MPREWGLWYFDVWHNSTPFIHGGHTAVIGFIHSVSGMPYTIRLQRRRQAPLAFDMLCAFAESINCPVNWIHTDNALELSKSKAMLNRCLERKIRITTTVAHRSRHNAMIERFWETMGMRVRASAADSENLPDCFWGYNMDDAVDCIALTPDPDDSSNMCPLGKILKGADVRGAYRRAWGCVCYPALHVTQRSNRSKTPPNSLRCINLGYAGSRTGAFEQLGYGRMVSDGPAAPGYLCYYPELDKIFRTSDCSFVETSFPGVARSKTGGWTVPEPDFLVRARSEKAPLAEPDQADADREPPMEWSKVGPPTFGVDDPEMVIDATSEPPPISAPDNTVDGGDDVADRGNTEPVEHGPPVDSTSDSVDPPPNGGVHGAPWETPTSSHPPEPPHEIPPTPNFLPTIYQQVTKPAGEEPIRPSLDEKHGTVSSDKVRGEWNVDHCSDSKCDLPKGHLGPHSYQNLPLRGPRTSRHGSNYNKALAVGLGQTFHEEIVALGLERGTLTHDILDDVTWAHADLAAMGAAECDAVLGMIKADELSAVCADPEAVKQSRNEYAAQVLVAAQHGVAMPALDPLVTMYSGPDTDACVLPFFGTEAFYDKYDGYFAHLEPSDLPWDIACLAKSKCAPDIFTERQMRGPEWDESKSLEVRELEAINAFEWVLETDPRIKGMTPVDTMWAGRDKRDAALKLTRKKARCCLRGDLQTKTYSLDKNQCYAPTTRDQTCLSAEANRCMRCQDKVSADVKNAYLQGKQLKGEQMLARPPPGWRRVDENGVRYLWLMNAPLYGQGDAGAIWNRTFNEFVEKPDPGLDMDRCDYDPCLYSKPVSGNEDDRCSMTLYVDDIQYYNDPTPTARAEREQSKLRLEHEYKIKFEQQNQAEEYMLGTNITRLNSHMSHLCCRTYITAKCKVYLDKPLDSYPSCWSNLPVDPKSFLDSYEDALQRREVDGCKKLRADYNSLVGALQYAVRRRPDVCFAVNVCARCLTFPTQGMYDHAIRILVYLGRTHSLGLTYSKHAEKPGLECYADSDWSIRRSTTGFVIMYAGAAIGFGSPRQHCIALSSTEAELMALATAALELLFFLGVLRALGADLPEGMPIMVHTDNSGAYDLCHRISAGQNSRHVDRKMYKMRELRGSGVVILNKIDGEKNPADFFTKPLTRQPFDRYRKFVMNLHQPVSTAAGNVSGKDNNDSRA